MWKLIALAPLILVTPAADAQTPDRTPSGERLLPAGTKAFLTVPQFRRFRESWETSQVGALLNRQIVPMLLDRLGPGTAAETGRPRPAATEEFVKVAEGQVTAAVIQTGPHRWGCALLAQRTGPADQAQELLDRLANRMRAAGAFQEESERAGTKIRAFCWTDADEGKKRSRFHFLNEHVWGIATDLEVVHGIADRAAGKTADSLAQVAAFRTVRERCYPDATATGPHVLWYVEPRGLLRWAEDRMASQQRASQRPGGRSLGDVLEQAGYLAVDGLGGVVIFGRGDHDLLHRTFVVGQATLTEPCLLEPQPWVPPDVTTYSSFSCDLLRLFDSVGPLFDELFAEGRSGAWDAVLDGLKNDPNGPRIDLRRELIVHLGRRVTVMADYAPPAGEGEQFLVAIEARDAEAVAAALRKLFQNDRQMRCRQYQGCLLWECVPEPVAAVPTVSLEMPALVPSLASAPEPVAASSDRLLPEMVVTVAEGNLVVASHPALLARMLDRPANTGSLATDRDFIRVRAGLAALGTPAAWAKVFTRPGEELRVSRQRWREGAAGSSQTILGRLIERLFGGRRPAAFPQPPRNRVASYEPAPITLGPAGHVVTAEPDGWFLTGFVLKASGLQTVRRPSEPRDLRGR